MDNLKKTLFEDTLYYFNEYLRLKNDLEEWDALASLQQSKFIALYTVIENAELEEEYQVWKGEQGNVKSEGAS